jgi:hypothetical protein
MSELFESFCLTYPDKVHRAPRLRFAASKATSIS